MAQTKYAALLSQNSDQKATASLTTNVKRAKLKIQADYTETVSELSNAQSSYDTALTVLPFSVENILKAKSRVRALSNGKSDLEGLYLELFGVNIPTVDDSDEAPATAEATA